MLHPSHKDLSLGTPMLHPSHKDLSLGTPDAPPQPQRPVAGDPDAGGLGGDGVGVGRRVQGRERAGDGAPRSALPRRSPVEALAVSRCA